MTNQIVSFEETEKVAMALQKSRYFNDVTNVEQAITKILAGREMGFGAFASMRGVYIIQGAPALSANLMAAAVKRSGRYNYRVREMTDQVCKIEFYEGGESIGVSEFTIENARKAGTKNLDKFPRNMLFARAMSNGVRWYCPDVLGGAAVYTPEELGANVNDEGDVIEVVQGEWTQEPEPAPETETPAEKAARELGFTKEHKTVIQRMDEKAVQISIEDAENVTTSEGIPYGTIESAKLAHMLNAMIKKGNPEHARKVAACKTILNARNNGRPVLAVEQVSE